MSKFGTFTITSTPIEDGREVLATVMEHGVDVTETLDGESQTVYLPLEELQRLFRLVFPSHHHDLLHDYSNKGRDVNVEETRTTIH